MGHVLALALVAAGAAQVAMLLVLARSVGQLTEQISKQAEYTNSVLKLLTARQNKIALKTGPGGPEIDAMPRRARQRVMRVVPESGEDR